MAKHHNSPESKIPTNNKIYEEHLFITSAQSSIDVLFHQMIKLHTQLRTQMSCLLTILVVPLGTS